MSGGYTLTTYQGEHTHRDGPHGSAKALRYRARLGLVCAPIPITHHIQDERGRVVYSLDLTDAGVHEWFCADWEQMTKEADGDIGI